MKKILLLIGFVSLTMNAQVQNEYQESSFQGQEEVSPHNPKVDSINSSSIGQTIKIGNLEIMKKDLGKFTIDDTNMAISALGKDWRLPTIKELEILQKNRKIIGGFEEDNYWSSSQMGADETWCLFFSNDNYPLHQSITNFTEIGVRAVRTIIPASNSNKKKVK